LFDRRAFVVIAAGLLMALLVLPASGARKAVKGKAQPPKAKTAESLSKARIFVADKEFDFGQVFEGGMLEHAFTVANKGTEPLIIERVAPG